MSIIAHALAPVYAVQHLLPDDVAAAARLLTLNMARSDTKISML